MLRFTLLIALSVTVGVSGFAPNAFSPSLRVDVPFSLKMAAEEEEPVSMVSSSFENEGKSSSQGAKNLVRESSGEQKWRDTELSANTNATPSIFSAIFVLVPGILLLNDAFHFLPKEWELI